MACKNNLHVLQNRDNNVNIPLNPYIDKIHAWSEYVYDITASAYLEAVSDIQS